ncbi:MAG TPA: adenylate/guanylate cyclase domain-containing protein [Roseiarcus sp.]|nr:adenylate/guanylate cyclase domain-containing protein [Roseiarcus sp.]
MAEPQTNRRLAAILAADVVGYSRLMGADEAGTLAALKHFRENLFNPAVAAHNGRVVKLIGDGTLVEFISVVDAVECAMAVQNAVAARVLPPGAPAIQLRIGVNLGDVIIDGDDIYGDGVNVAARLEPLAEPGGVCISSIVHESVGNRIDGSFRDFGQVQVKNIDRPIAIWKWRPGEAGAAPAKKPEREVKSAAPPIAVLPFDNMSGDPGQDYFSDGVAEDIITDLAKIAGLIVIARNSSFAYKGKKFDVRDIARELNVRFVLEGSIRHAGNRVRVTAQLIDATSGAHLWAERYDRDLTDIFAVQDDLTQRIVGALKVTLSPAEKARIADSGAPANAAAHDRFMRARELLLGSTQNRETFEQAVATLSQAVELDPNYAQAYAGLAWAYVLDYTNQWSDESGRALDHARRYADQAVATDPREPLAYFASAMVAGRQRDFKRAVADANAALALSPNFAPARGLMASFELFAGRPLEAIAQMERNMRLDPVVSQQGLQFLGLAYLVAGKYETAALVFRQRLVLAPGSDSARSCLASALGHMGQIEEARRVWDELKAINPNYSFAGHMGRLPFERDEDVKRIAEGLTKASLPID